ncbi:hypothetical protein H0H93_012253 [Arthromyces matolae]|nr:hypothetical protein H0H93_012253 [Arthromyces matolae]
MLRLDLMFALTEEHDFNDWPVAWLKQRLENDRLVFLQNIEQPLARDCLVRIQYFQAVLDHKHNIIDTKPAPPQLPPGDVVPKDNRYTTFLRNEIKNILHDGTARSRLTLAQRITELGLQYNLLRELGFPKKETRNLVNLKDFEVEDGSSEAAREQCVARAKYYLDLLPEVSSR